MGNLGTWRSPLPMRLGGNGHKRIGDVYNGLRASRPSILKGEEWSEVDLEDKALARLINTGFRAVDRRVSQNSPLKLLDLERPVTNPDDGTVTTTSMLKRWESILGTLPPSGADPAFRRQLIAGKRAAYDCSVAGVSTVVSKVFGSWPTTVKTLDFSYIVSGAASAHWATPSFTFTADYPGSYNANYPWYSKLARIVVEYTPPTQATKNEITYRVSSASRILDDLIPAWCQFGFSQSAGTSYPTGFILNVSQLNATAL